MNGIPSSNTEAFRSELPEVMMEGEVLAANPLRVEERRPWGDCGNWRSCSCTHGYAHSRRSETGRLFSFADCSYFQQVTIDLGSNDGGRFGIA